MCFQINNVSDLWFQVHFHPIFTYEKFFFDFKSKKSKLQKTKSDFETSTSNRLNNIAATETNFNLFYFHFTTVWKMRLDQGSSDRSRMTGPSKDDWRWTFRSLACGKSNIPSRISIEHNLFEHFRNIFYHINSFFTFY